MKQMALIAGMTLFLCGHEAAAQVPSTRNLNPSWSPDGSQLAFVSNREGNPEIYVVNLNGGAPENLSQHSGLDLSPAWSHDGRFIAFVSNRDGQNDLYAVRVEDRRVIRLTDRGDVLTSALTWSPDSH